MTGPAGLLATAVLPGGLVSADFLIPLLAPGSSREQLLAALRYAGIRPAARIGRVCFFRREAVEQRWAAVVDARRGRRRNSTLRARAAEFLAVAQLVEAAVLAGDMGGVRRHGRSAHRLLAYLTRAARETVNARAG